MSDCNYSPHSLTSGLDAMSLKVVSPSKLNQRRPGSTVVEKQRKASASRRLVDADRSTPAEVVSKMKNENFHLQLELEEKNHEIAKLKSMLLPKLTPPAIDLRFTTSLRDPLYYHPESNKITNMSGAQVTYSDLVSHFSSSSYDGNRNGVDETSTVASTTTSRKEKNHMLFTRNILPFIRDCIDTYRGSHILNEEVLPIHEQFDKFYDKTLTKEERCEVITNVLAGLLRVQRLNVAALNRELELKTVERKMDYLATMFLNPQEYEIPRHTAMKRIRNQMLDVIISLYGELPSPSRMLTDSDKKLQDHSELLLKHTSNHKSHKNVQTHAEILPIGYTSSSSKPVRSVKKRMRNIKLTPFKTASQENVDPKDELDVDISDPLQLLLSERLRDGETDSTHSLTNSF
ncbi:unnamed protein product [Kluyveromyces dobzhanskii CBS 2104]|uniref:WGS project CCBQ000000000 data, contig 00098 n=1 Tax=Kluyveromyces dobzhanskii CBS 2104 TaxID=1427455 RepID=A0A0A8L348_9SACH|nr:unnamed protein product [Kluyveromyces dobzhanskii CBS 2104]